MKDIIIDGWHFKYEVCYGEWGSSTRFYYGVDGTERYGFLWQKVRPKPIYRFSLGFDIENPYVSVELIRSHVAAKNIVSMVESYDVKGKWFDNKPLVIDTKIGV